jgi:hypothetical protein
MAIVIYPKKFTMASQVSSHCSIGFQIVQYISDYKKVVALGKFFSAIFLRKTLVLL